MTRAIAFAGLLAAGALAVGPSWALGQPRRERCSGVSARLAAIETSDQDDRKDWRTWTATQSAAVNLRDEQRRVEVAGLFAKGCLQSADDYWNAALVFQHGDVPDHFLQAALWALRAVELGRSDAKSLAAMAVDRDLMERGYKQLYASQARSTSTLGPCHCLWPVEESATDDDRRKMGRPGLAEQLRWVDELNKGKDCKPARQCDETAKPVPKGSLPGIPW